MWIAKVSFFFLFSSLPQASLEKFFPFFLFPAFGLALQGPSPTIARPDGLAPHRGLHKRQFRRALMAPMPVERCSVLCEPGARRHALESEGLGGVKAALRCKYIVYTATVVVYKHLRGCSEWRESVLMAHSLVAFVPARRYQVPWSPGSDRPDSAIAPRGQELSLPAGGFWT